MDTIEYHSPCGILHLAATDGKLLMCDWADSPRHRRNLGQLNQGEMDYDVISCAETQLDEYFSGRRHRFDIEVSPAGTPFRRRVWECLAEIPFGGTMTYKKRRKAADSHQYARRITDLHRQRKRRLELFSTPRGRKINEPFGGKAVLHRIGI